ncbi:MAG: HAD family phosphatase, partial [bacterium]|nr:HAD family phosphatase [bacterium]
NENVTPGLTGSVTPGLTGSATPGLTGSATPGLAGVSEEAFEEGWNTLFGPLVPGIEELLIRLKKNYRLVALSNTNKIHAQFWKNKYARILPHFERVFCSNEIKARKPEKRAYQIVLNYLELKPGDVIFLDDMEENIEGAEGMRIQSIRVKTIPQVIQDLEGNGVL